ncbi:hypothetical protein J1C56_01810 [Aminobacter anthyllidis]|uniref:Uncharacterized protein n=1 Tax=Aminobacter anthyllidis TaxID=1035067 RepID=A0A9X1D0V6_9HYPH|nr:hypothetical protein [Aminobacter anthyllidis]MBT1154320.1 hypothetical protein [Aminobacter anthyllidis]
MQPDIQDICAQIRYQHRQRVYAMDQRKRADLALGSFLRMVLGWRLDLPKAEADAIKAKAAFLVDIGADLAKQSAKPVEKQKVVIGLDDHDFIEWQNLIMASIKARSPFDNIEAATTKEMERLAVQLPAWSDFGQHVRGFGARSLAVIVAEAGDLSAYPKKGHLWKRMGLAVMDGVRQGGLSKSASKQDWIEHGYNGERRSRMFVIGDTMIKSGDTYRAVYLARKDYERQRAEASGLIVAPSAKIPAKRKDEFVSDGHIHRRAQRYMEKRLLRDLWQAWRWAQAGVPDRAKVLLPAAETNHREANLGMPEMAVGQLPIGDPNEMAALP